MSIFDKHPSDTSQSENQSGDPMPNEGEPEVTSAEITPDTSDPESSMETCTENLDLAIVALDELIAGAKAARRKLTAIV